MTNHVPVTWNIIKHKSCSLHIIWKYTRSSYVKDSSNLMTEVYLLRLTINQSCSFFDTDLMHKRFLSFTTFLSGIRSMEAQEWFILGTSEVYILSLIITETNQSSSFSDMHLIQKSFWSLTIFRSCIRSMEAPKCFSLGTLGSTPPPPPPAPPAQFKLCCLKHRL